MATKFSIRMDPIKQLRREISEEQRWNANYWQLESEVQRLFNAGRPFPAARDEAMRNVGWQ